MADVERVVATLKDEEPRSIERLREWLRIPSVGTDPAHNDDTRRAGQWAADFLRGIGVDASLRETGTKAKPGHPIVWAQHPGSKDYQGPHVLFYGHYDVQPPDPLELWESPPFEPIIKPAIPDGPGERIVARGACDDKGQVATFLEAMRAWHSATGEVPMKVTILLEGEEESGSSNLEPFLREHEAELRKCDVCLISDTGMLGRGRTAITYGVRGLAYTQVTLHGPDQDLHSGLWGGRVPNPINELSKVLAQLWDDRRRVTIPGFYDGVRNLPDEVRSAWAELGFDQVAALKKIGLGPDADVGEAGFTAIEREWARPTCDINGIWGGYQGPGAKTVIASKATAKVSFRLVDDQDPHEIAMAFKAWLEARTPAGCRFEFDELHGGAPATVATDSPHLQAARRALSAVGGQSGGGAPLIKTGGSIPIVGLFKTLLGLDTILMGFGLDDDRVHSPNEKFELDCFRLGSEAHVRLVEAFSEMGATA